MNNDKQFLNDLQFLHDLMGNIDNIRNNRPKQKKSVSGIEDFFSGLNKNRKENKNND